MSDETYVVAVERMIAVPNADSHREARERAAERIGTVDQSDMKVVVVED